MTTLTLLDDLQWAGYGSPAMAFMGGGKNRTLGLYEATALGHWKYCQ